MAELVQLLINTDGASRGNPGDAAFAYVIQRNGQPPIEEGGCLGQMTNNQAEYTALVRALEHALRLGPNHRVLIRSDSELMVRQMKGEYKVKNDDLRGLFSEARQLAGQFKGGVVYQHVRREQNKRADELCNEALDGRRRPAPVGEVGSEDSDPVIGPFTLEDEVLAYLGLADAQPSPEVVWRGLVALLKKYGVALPGR